MHKPDTHPLDLVEQQFHQVAAFLAVADANQLPAAAQQLQTLCMELARQLPGLQRGRQPGRGLQQRVHTLAQGLQMLRDTLSRQAAANQQALQVVLPTAPKATYAGGTSVYGTVARQGGVHKYLAA